MNVKQLRERFEKSNIVTTLPFAQQASQKKIQKRQDIVPQVLKVPTKQENIQIKSKPVNPKIQQDYTRKVPINSNFLDELSSKLNKNGMNNLAQQTNKNQLPSNLPTLEIRNIKRQSEQKAIKQQKSEIPPNKAVQPSKKQKLIKEQKPEKQIKIVQASEISFDDILSNASTQKSREHSTVTRYGIDEHHPKGSDNQIFSKLIEQQKQSKILDSQSPINKNPKGKKIDGKIKQQSSIISRVGQHIFKRSDTITQDQKISQKAQKNIRINYIIDLIFGESDIENIPKKQYQTFEESKKLNQMLQTIDQILITKIQDKKPLQLVQNNNEAQIQTQRQKSAVLPNQVLAEMIAKFQNKKPKMEQINKPVHQNYHIEAPTVEKPMEKERNVTPRAKKNKRKLQNFDDI